MLDVTIRIAPAPETPEKWSEGFGPGYVHVTASAGQSNVFSGVCSEKMVENYVSLAVSAALGLATIIEPIRAEYEADRPGEAPADTLTPVE